MDMYKHMTAPLEGLVLACFAPLENYVIQGTGH